MSTGSFFAGAARAGSRVLQERRAESAEERRRKAEAEAARALQRQADEAASGRDVAELAEENRRRAEDRQNELTDSIAEQQRELDKITARGKQDRLTKKFGHDLDSSQPFTREDLFRHTLDLFNRTYDREATDGPPAEVAFFKAGETVRQFAGLFGVTDPDPNAQNANFLLQAMAHEARTAEPGDLALSNARRILQMKDAIENAGIPLTQEQNNFIAETLPEIFEVNSGGAKLGVLWAQILAEPPLSTDPAGVRATPSAAGQDLGRSQQAFGPVTRLQEVPPPDQTPTGRQIGGGFGLGRFNPTDPMFLRPERADEGIRAAQNAPPRSELSQYLKNALALKDVEDAGQGDSRAARKARSRRRALRLKMTAEQRQTADRIDFEVNR